MFSARGYDNTLQTEVSNRDSSIYKTLTKVNALDKEICEKTLQALKAIIPQKQINDLQDRNRLAKTIGLDMVYGILSYEGPTIALCDIKKKQVVV